MRSGAGLLALGLALSLAGTAQARPLKVMALDQCADQYVLALAPDAQRLLSHRADDADSFLRNAAKGHRMVRPSLETAVAERPDVVVRYWGGDARLLRRLERDGITVVTIEDSRDFDGIRENIRQVSQALNADGRGAEMIRTMDAKLSSSAGSGQGRKAAYLTASGFSAGPDTLIDSILRAAGFRNAMSPPGYQPFGLERALLQPPFAIVRGFFEQVFADWRGTGRHPALNSLHKEDVVADLPASTLTCPAWFAADAVVTLAEGSQ